MQYKKQFRWLLFLLIPFIAMLAVLIVTPLQIASLTHPLIGSAYASLKITPVQNIRRALTLTHASAVQNIIAKYLNFISPLRGLKISQYNTFSINQAMEISSAYELAQAATNSTAPAQQVAQQSMWFATNAQKYDQLTPDVKTIWSQYSKQEAFIRCALQGGTVTSITNLFLAPNSSIYFAYPAKYQPDYSSLSAPAQGSFYPDIIQTYQSNPSLNSIAAVRLQSHSNRTYLSLCQPFTDQNITSIPCLHLEMAKLLQEIASSGSFTPDALTSTYLIVHTTSATNAAFLLWEGEATWSAMNLSGLGFSQADYGSREVGSDDNIIIRSAKAQTYFLSPIGLYNGPYNTAAMSLLTVCRPPSEDFQEGVQADLNILIIPVVVLVLLGSLASALILKKLLDSLDKQLFVLQNLCKFIVGGDINIEIPEYRGTKDIAQVYEQARIINKLHRYSTNSYFTGHFAEKILKYNEALEFMSSLNYDVGNVLENMGQAYTYIEEWDNSISALDRSVELGFRQLKAKFNLTMDEVLRLKKEKKGLPSGYREFQVVLIRRMFKLGINYIKYLELRSTFTKEDRTELTVEEEEFRRKIEKMTKACMENLRLLKIAFYPDFSSYSECIISFYTQAKQMANVKDLEGSKRLMDAAVRFTKKYTQQYQETTKRLKEKGSKYKLLHQKNKLTAHSRTHPEILKLFRNIFESKIINTYNPSPSKYNEIIKNYTDGVKVGIITLSLTYTIVIEARKLLISLKIDPSKFETTQVFRQVVPFQTLYYGEVTKEIEPQLLKFPTKTSPGLERQFVLLFDGAKSMKSEEKASSYMKERVFHLFEKLVKKTDRVSIIRFNVKSGIKIQCNLILKESNEEILKKEIESTFGEAGESRGSLECMVEGLMKTVNRIKGLQCDKVVVMFLKSLEHYRRIADRQRRKKRTESFLLSSGKSVEEEEVARMEDFGEYVEKALSAEGLRNCKLVMHCGKEDSIEKVRSFFGLEDINRRIWRGYNFQNNLVYLIEEKHKLDLDRILMLKTQDIPDNNVFGL